MLLAALLPSPTLAQTIITSDTPEAVSLTVYRAPERGQNPIDPNWPQGYALITETRTITIPAGEALIRFEGVAEGMFPESAIVTGLPKGVKEKNRDARLLSPSGLVDAYLKRQVTLTRTDKATGKVREQEAMITAGPDGGVILRTADGYEALRCTGLPERMGYGGVPANLSAKPTLSVITQSDAERTVKLTLTYMASGFDWQANYVAQAKELDEGTVGKGKVDIFAWLTLANGGNQSFADANMMAIAGAPNRESRDEGARPTGGPLYLECWPGQRTHEVPYNLGYLPNIPPPPPPAAPMAMAEYDGENIIVTAQKRSRDMMESASPVAVVVAEQEDLGDLKLYRVPEPVTVNAKGQKQVAMIVKPGAKFERLYRANVGGYYGDNGSSQPMAIMLRSENRSEKGLGLPMPSGQVMVFEDSRFGPLLAGEAALDDRAVGDDVEMTIGQSSDVRYAVTQLSEKDKKQRWKVEITNARNEPVNVEIEIPFELLGRPKHIPKKHGMPTWAATVPANGEANLFYDVRLEK